ncbi:DUF4468 domain-containing protein [Zunongwangia endophytica]|uniref:DUF4468 domain-containing protein n=1 Tax=Zunongwangia endophytica TaxID=1808945 RepID=A0ABV8H3K1_9FLAO|nr:DUF4468 domain-containing protein [Zunongwangia endophytica]MDN3596055.1 DUF4468 domain-containing protein [Zunongwangia endophytica]
MKRFIIVFLLCLSTAANAQFNEEGNLYYEETITAEGVSQEQIKEKLHEWLLAEFDQKNIKASKNTETEMIVDINSEINIKQGESSTTTDLYFGILSNFKDDQYKIQISHLDVGPTQTPVKINFPDFESFKTEMQETVNRLSGDAKAKNQAILDDKEKIKDIYQRGLQNHENMLASVKAYISGLVERLKKTIK